MGIPEPASHLWAAVKNIDDEIWPPDDEDVAMQLGRTVRDAGGHLQSATTQIGTDRQQIAAGWHDGAGDSALSGLEARGARFGEISGQATSLGDSANGYAHQLIDAKSTITRIISENQARYDACDSLPPALQEPARRRVASFVAAQLRKMIDQKAEQLVGPHQQGAKDAGKWGDVFGAISAGAGLLAWSGVLAPVALPVSLLTGLTAAGLHGYELANDPEAQGDVSKYVGLGGDIAGAIVPGAKIISEGRPVLNALRAAGAPDGIDAFFGTIGGMSQAPTLIGDFAGGNDMAGEVGNYGGGGSSLLGALAQGAKALG